MHLLSINYSNVIKIEIDTLHFDDDIDRLRFNKYNDKNGIII